jgi:hypothetical protein
MVFAVVVTAAVAPSPRPKMMEVAVGYFGVPELAVMKEREWEWTWYSLGPPATG